MTGWIVLALLVVAGLAIALEHDRGPLSGLATDDLVRLFMGAALLLLVGVPLLSRYRGRLPTAVRDFLAWAVLGLLLVAGYSYREELRPIAERVMGELSPAGAALEAAGEAGEKAVRIRRHSDGHFFARTEIDGETIRMIVDTGASTVVLRPSDAELLGFDLSALRFDIPVNTANGSTFAARVKLRSVGIGPVVVPDVEALVARPGALHESLLGMSFLSRLRSYEFSGDFLTLRG
jgi:aspartyl protease family protein